MSISQYATERFEQEIENNDIANEIKKAFFSYCSMIAPEEFSTNAEKLGYSYIFIRNMAEFLYNNDFDSPVFSIDPEDLDESIDEEMIDIMCEDIEDFCITWTNDDIAEENIKAIPLLKTAFPDAPLITNILGIAVGLPDDSNYENEDLDPYEQKLAQEIEEINAKIRENHIKQAVVMQAYIKEIKKKNFPIDAKMLILNYFKEAAKNRDVAWKNLIDSPAFFSPIQVDKLVASGIKEKDIPKEAHRINKEIGVFLKTMKL